MSPGLDWDKSWPGQSHSHTVQLKYKHTNMRLDQGDQGDTIHIHQKKCEGVGGDREYFSITKYVSMYLSSYPSNIIHLII